MPYHFTSNMLPLVVATAISGALGWFTWQNRRTPGATPFSLMLFILFEWSLTYIFQLAATDFQLKVFWLNVTFIGVVSLPVAWMTFAFEYTGRKEWINARRLAMLSIIPLITLLIIFTNESHHLFRTSEKLVLEGGFLLLDTANGPWFWIHGAYNYTLIMIGLFLIVRALLRWPEQYRGQMIWILLSTLMPLIANITTIFKLLPIIIDLTPFAFIVTGTGLAYAIFRHRLLDIVPLARDVVIERMQEGMIVLDASRRIADINLAAKDILGLLGEKQPIIGKPVADVLDKWPALIEHYRNVSEAKDEVTIGEGESCQWYELHLSTLHDENKEMTGQIITIRDITWRKKAESLVQESDANRYLKGAKTKEEELRIQADIDALTNSLHRQEIIAKAPKKAERKTRKNIDVSNAQVNNYTQNINNHSNLLLNKEREKISKKIFISYRRNDSSDVSGRIYDRLIQSFNKDTVFKDVDSIPLGRDFRDILDEAVRRSDVVLVVIGSQWLELKDANGKRRIDDSRDYVRTEIEIALECKIPVIPILVQGADMPSANKLPLSIRDLAYKNGLHVRPDPDFHRDMDRLISHL